MKKNRVRYFPVLLSAITCSHLFIPLENANAQNQWRCDERIYNWVDKYYYESRSAIQNRVEKICQSSNNLIQLKCLGERYKYYDSRYFESRSDTAGRAISYCTQEALNSSQDSQPSQSSQDKLINCVIKVVNKGLSERIALRICRRKVCNPGSRRNRRNRRNNR